MLKPAAPTDPLIQSYVVVHTRRYVARAPPPPLCTETLALSAPVPVEVQLPRRTFHSGEIIPVYITIPPVGNGFSENSGLTLRNISTQLRRIVSASITQATDSLSGSLPSDEGNILQNYSDEFASTMEKPYLADDAQRDDEDDDVWRTVVAKTGSACRFHETRTVKLRLLLRLPPADLGPGSISSAASEGVSTDTPDCGLITQSTLLGSAEFKILVSASFISARESRERVASLSIPITILPPQAPASDIDPSLDAAYRKKHDRPPLRTTRHPQAETSISHDEGGAGPSGQPPPFEDADIPPPFSVESNLNSHPPTFVESQADLTDFQVYNDQMQQSQQQSTVQYAPEGEGVLFGFPASEEFDGTQNPNVTPSPFQIRSSVPPQLPSQTLNPHLRGSRDRNAEDLSAHDSLPPGIDDPSDPPPAIDVAYLAAPNAESTLPLDPPPPPHSDEDPHPLRTSPPPVVARHAASAAPPPYLNPPIDSEPRNSVIRPPPYMESSQDLEH
jgi:hypothetical protein